MRCYAVIIKTGDIFESKAKTIVNAVNCVGVMGKGIALEFKRRYPEMFKEYAAMCSSNAVQPGIPYFYKDRILNFPTKNHWRSPSKLSYIISGLKWFRENYQAHGVESIAIPALGCGNGGLSWDVVGPVMYAMLKDLPIEVELYAPYGTPQDRLTIDFLEANLAELSKVF